ncbi:MAG: DUF3791 domain-containing protein [Oscillibacter sp.]|nr:DUF3791 domain-containing protein [Oscillibacter sp.]
MNNDIIFLQNSCLMAYMEKHKLDTFSASKVFQAYNIFGYIREHFEYLHLMGVEYIVQHLDSIIGEK